MNKNIKTKDDVRFFKMLSIYKPNTKKIVEISLSIAAAQPGFGLAGTVPTCCMTFTSIFGADTL